MVQAFFENHFRTLFFIVLLIGAFNVFFKLGTERINAWDEARYGVSAYEMLTHKTLIHNTYLDKPDYWNLKPPLGLW